MAVVFKLPDLGENIESGEVVSVVAAVGDVIEVDQTIIEVETDKEQYQPRDKVKMIVRVKDERGMPMPAQLSLAVSDDQLLTFADDKSGNILSQLLL